MRLTVLGAYGSFPGPDGACSGYMVEADGLHVLLDAGNGVLSRLERYVGVQELDGIFVSHLHFDHMADLLVLQYGLDTMRALQPSFRPLLLHTPETPPEIAGLLGRSEVFTRTFIHDAMLVQLGAMTFSFARMAHPVETYAVSITAGGRKLVYSSDTVYTPRLAEFAQGADLFLCEATAIEGQPAAPGLPHLTARQAGEIAAQAGVGQLLLTHYWFELPGEEYAAQARTAFPRSALAEELVTYEV